MVGQGRDNALDHVVVVEFENRSLNNVLGRLYGPGDGKTPEQLLNVLRNSLPPSSPCGLRPLRTRAPRLTRV